MLSAIFEGSFSCLILLIVSEEIFMFIEVSFSNLLTAVYAKGNKSSSLTDAAVFPVPPLLCALYSSSG